MAALAGATQTALKKNREAKEEDEASHTSGGTPASAPLDKTTHVLSPLTFGDSSRRRSLAPTGPGALSTDESEFGFESLPDGEVSVDFPPEVSKKIIASLSWQRRVHAIFDAAGVEEEHYVDQHKVVRAVLLTISFSLIIVSVVVFTIESQPEYYKRDLTSFWTIEAVCISWFTFELSIRAWAAPSLRIFCKSVMNWIDFLSVFPFYLDLLMMAITGKSDVSEDASGLVLIRVVRLTRAFRVFKLSKYNEGLHIVVSAVNRSTDALSLLAFLTTIATVLFGSAMFYAEQGAADFDKVSRQWVRRPEYGGPEKAHPFKSIPHSFWWCFVTVTTVGYGDMYPVTGLGYVVASAAMLTGLLLIAFPIIILGLNFSDARDQFLTEKARDQEALRLQKQHLMQKLTEQIGGDNSNNINIEEVIKEVEKDVVVPSQPKETVASLLGVLMEKVDVLEDRMNRRFGAVSCRAAISPMNRKKQLHTVVSNLSKIGAALEQVPSSQQPDNANANANGSSDEVGPDKGDKGPPSKPVNPLKGLQQ